MLGKCLFQDCWLKQEKDSVYQEWDLKDKLDKHYARCVACEIWLIFMCSLLLQWSLQNLILVLLTKSLSGPYGLFGSSPSPWEPQYFM